MDARLVFRRTEKGEEELKTRRHGLDQRHRMALILVDGRADVDGLRDKAGGMAALEVLLEDLAVAGYVAADDPAWQPAPRGSDADEALRAKLVDLAVLVLGDRAGPVVKKLRAAAPDRAGLEEALKKAHKLARLTIDEALADELLEKGRRLLAG